MMHEWSAKNLDIIIPFWNGNKTIKPLLDSIPDKIRVFLVCDHGSESPVFSREKVCIIKLDKRGYFAGACNVGMKASGKDVLILNQDSLLSRGWQNFLKKNRDNYSIVGDGVFGHPAWPNGYVQGTFMYISRKVIEKIGHFNQELYPLWGGTCEYQLRACRAGFTALPIRHVPGYNHCRKQGGFGDAITKTLETEPDNRAHFIKTPPEISVIVPCYNYGRFLDECISSILNQTFQSTEIIIVDDCSTDNSFEVSSTIANGWIGVKSIQTRQNLGTAGALNFGIEQSRGKYIAILDADDMMAETRLETMYDALMSNIGGKIFVYDDMIFRSCHGDEIKESGDFNLIGLVSRNNIHTGLLYPKQAWRDVSGYLEIMGDGRQDWAFNVALGISGWYGVRIAEPMYIRRIHDKNRTNTNTTPQKIVEFRNRILSSYPAAQEIYDKRYLHGGLIGRDGMVKIRYVGGNVGTETYECQNDGVRYTFSMKEPVKYVAARHAPYLLSLVDKRGKQRRKVFVKE